MKAMYVYEKILSLMLIVITIVSTAAMPISAANSADIQSVAMAMMPRFNNGDACNLSFGINNTGLANIRVTYYGISGVTTRVTATMSIEKKVSSNTWERVDIGTLTNSWTDSSTNLSGTFSHTFQLESTGTYRGVFVIRMFGSGGTADKIEKTIEKTYS